MKTLFVHRHAKSSWKHPELSDHDRPLNKRGIKNAEFMSKLFAEKRTVDLLLSSTAERAFRTAEYYQRALNLPEDLLRSDRPMYFAGHEDLLRIINRIPEQFSRVMLFGHNPTLTDLCQYLDHRFDDYLVTCSRVEITFDLPTWEMVSRDTGEVQQHIYPKLFPEMR